MSNMKNNVYYWWYCYRRVSFVVRDVSEICPKNDEYYISNDLFMNILFDTDLTYQFWYFWFQYLEQMSRRKIYGIIFDNLIFFFPNIGNEIFLKVWTYDPKLIFIIIRWVIRFSANDVVWYIYIYIYIYINISMKDCYFTRSSECMRKYGSALFVFLNFFVPSYLRYLHFFLKIWYHSIQLFELYQSDQEWRRICEKIKVRSIGYNDMSRNLYLYLLSNFSEFNQK